MLGSSKLTAELRSALRLPMAAAPMFLVSGPDLVAACCAAGVIGVFPTLNARSPHDLRTWMEDIRARNEAASRSGGAAAPFAANLIVHATNERFGVDLDLIEEFRVPIVVTSVGSPRNTVARIHGYGGLVFSDVASIRHARAAAESGADGLILLCAGAGGNTGWLNPFAFVPAVREFFAGPVFVAGCVSNGGALRAIEELGGDFGYVGTRFIATRESMADDGYRALLAQSSADDILQTSDVSGIPANFLRASLERCGFTIDGRHADKGFAVAREIEVFKKWKDIWSAGQGVGAIRETTTVAELIAEFAAQYEPRVIEETIA